MNPIPAKPRKVDKPLILYGYGKLGHLAEEIFKEIGIPIFKILDKSKNIPIQEQKHYREWRRTCLVAACIATQPWHSRVKAWTSGRHRLYATVNHLRKQGWEDIVPVWDIIEAYPEANLHNGWFTYPCSKEEFTQTGVLSQFAFTDTISRVHYSHFLFWRRFRKEGRWWSKKPILDGRYKIPEVLSALRDVEKCFLEHSGSTLADVRKRQKIDIFEEIYTYIELHAEGCELQTLEQNKEYLQKHRPILCVTCYHSRDGLWKIPMFLHRNLENYRLLFRLHAYMGQGAVVYAIPDERG